MNKALVVDDSTTTRTLIANMLVKFGFDAIEAGDGKEAISVLEKHPEVRIAFVDWNMPVMTGIQFLHIVRQDSNLNSLRIVMVTGNTEMDFVVSAIKEGADEYIMLPITSEILEEKLALLGIYPK